MATSIKIFSAYLHSLTAGLSPHKNERVELFFAGCRMAREGNPCDGCFNQDLWYDDYCHIQTAEDIVSYIKKMTKITAVIPIRSGSQRVKDKNHRPL